MAGVIHRPEQLGWSEHFARAFAALGDDALIVGRVAVIERGAYQLLTAEGPRWARLPTRFARGVSDAAELPAVGDWLVVQREHGELVAHTVLPRRTFLVRRAAGRRAMPQAVCANVDTIFIVTAIGPDLSQRRLERYVAAIRDGGALPVILLNKTDLATALDAALDAARAAAPGIEVIACSAHSDPTLAPLEPFLISGHTVAFVGSSGVGKSTLINRILGEQRQATAEVRASDDKGRHTTTRRELLVAPNGAIIIDTPGMRELGLWNAMRGVELAFPEVDAIAQNCRFRDCRHLEEPGCAVVGALAAGTLDAARVQSWRVLAGEQSGAPSSRAARARECRTSARRHKPNNR